MASLMYPKMIELLNTGTLSWTGDTIRILLVNASATYNRAHDFVNDVVANELSGGGYARQTLTGKTSADNGTDIWSFDADNATFLSVATSQTANAAIVYKFITDDASSPLLGFVDGANLTTNGSDVLVTFSASGALGFRYTGF